MFARSMQNDNESMRDKGLLVAISQQNKIVKDISNIVNKKKNMAEIADEWRELAISVDRLLFCVFLLAAIIINLWLVI